MFVLNCIQRSTAPIFFILFLATLNIPSILHPTQESFKLHLGINQNVTYVTCKPKDEPQRKLLYVPGHFVEFVSSCERHCSVIQQQTQKQAGLGQAIELAAFWEVTSYLSREQVLRLLDCLHLEGGFRCRTWATPRPLSSFVFSSFSHLRMLLSWGWFWLPWMILLCGFHMVFYGHIIYSKVCSA